MGDAINHRKIEQLKKNIENSTNIYDIVVAAYITFGAYSSQKKANYKADDYRELMEYIVAFDQCVESNPASALSQLQLELVDWLSEKKQVKYLDVYALILNIDRNHQYRMPAVALSSRRQHFEEFFGLNYEHKRYQVIPRVRDSISMKMNSAFEQATGKGLRKRGSGYSGKLNSELRHYDIFDKEKETYLPLIHRFTENAAKKIKKRLEKKGHYLTVGLFPLWGRELCQTLEFDYTANTFSVKGMIPEVEIEIQKRIEQAFVRCKEMKVDVAIFPEMMMTRSNLEKLISHVEMMSEDELPMLMIMGTVWETVIGQEGQDKRNVSVVLSCFGDVVIEQHKQTPFSFEKPHHEYAEYEEGHEEELSLKDKNIRIIDIEDVGRFFTLVCRDVLNEAVMAWPKGLYADMVLVPAFSKSKNLRGELNLLTADYWGVALLCNSCSALCPPGKKWIPEEIIRENIPVCPERMGKKANNKDKEYLEMGFVLTPAKEGTVPKAHYNPIHFSKLCIACQSRECPGWIFDIHYKTFLFPDEEYNYGRIGVQER